MNIDKKYRSYYYEFRSQTLNWSGSDSIDLYEKNLKNNYSELKKYGWIDSQFTYKFNSYGFRCEEFDNKPTMMTLGCSNTFGTGLPVDKIWPELLAKDLNMKCANLGIGGGSLDTAFRMCEGYIDIINPKLVVLLEPPEVRMELFLNDINNGPSMLGPWIAEHFNPYHHESPPPSDYDPKNYSSLITTIKNFTESWITNENNCYFNRKKNILAIEQICMERNIKFIYTVYTPSFDFKTMLPSSFARDLMHGGVEDHKKITKELLTKL
jgi:hypothetical protein